MIKFVCSLKKKIKRHNTYDNVINNILYRFSLYHYSCHIFHLAYNEKFVSYLDKSNNFFYWNNNNPLYYRYADAIFNDYYFSKFY